MGRTRFGMKRNMEVDGKQRLEEKGRSRRTARATTQGKLTSKQKRKEEKEKQGTAHRPWSQLGLAVKKIKNLTVTSHQMRRTLTKRNERRSITNKRSFM